MALFFFSFVMMNTTWPFPLKNTLQKDFPTSFREVINRLINKDTLPLSPLFYSLFGTLPNVEYWRMVDDELFLPKLRAFCEEFPPDWVRQINYFDTAEPESDPSLQIAYLSGVIIETVNKNHFSIAFQDPENPLLNKLRELLAASILKPEFKSNISMLCSSNRGFFLAEHEISPLKGPFLKHYNEDIRPIYKTLQQLTQNVRSGLVLLHGEPGTGKTSFIRKLIETSKRRVIMIPTHLLEALENPSIVELYSEFKDSIFVIEDADDALRKRGTSRSNLVATILNFTDGLLAAMLNVTFICTFNLPIRDLDPALLRQGRLLVRYEFKKLSEQRVKSIRPKWPIEMLKPMTLAEVLAKPVIENCKSRTLLDPVGYQA